MPQPAGTWILVGQVPAVVSQAQFEEVRAKLATNRPFARRNNCTAPGSLDNRLSYAARLRVWSCQAARMSLGLRWPFFSMSHSAL